MIIQEVRLQNLQVLIKSLFYSLLNTKNMTIFYFWIEKKNLNYTSGVPPYAKILCFNSPNLSGGGLINDGESTSWWTSFLSRWDFDLEFFKRSLSANKRSGPRLE